MTVEKLVVATLLCCWPAMAAPQQSSQTAETQSSTQSSSQTQQDPVAAAAKRTREQKKDQPKAAKVWDNDNIPSKPDAITVLGDTSSASSGTDQNPAAAPSATPEAAKKAEASDKEKAAISGDVAAAKEHLQSLNTDLDILTRKYALDQQMYYNETNYAEDKDGAAKMKDEEDEIDAKKQEIAEAQKKIDELSAKLGANQDDSSKPASNPQ